MTKTWRLCIVLLLALLLPLRGAVAATTMCAPATAGSQHAMAVTPPTHAEHATPHDHAAMLAHAQHAPSSCSVCADCCAPAMVFGDVPAPTPPVLFATALFPAPRALAPSFMSDGPERPPRRC